MLEPERRLILPEALKIFFKQIVLDTLDLVFKQIFQLGCPGGDKHDEPHDFIADAFDRMAAHVAQDNTRRRWTGASRNVGYQIRQTTRKRSEETFDWCNHIGPMG